ncbi:MAG TPA: sugar ABC transporter permease [Acidimicrobiales bacterium]|jgi:multiple sugar transport system permease protein|nr:sugar ABC transporter permease [Acidimicrobiales bacterium]
MVDARTPQPPVNGTSVTVDEDAEHVPAHRQRGAGAAGAPGRTARARSEHRLGWYLAGPALAIMVLVTAYPLGRAVWLSLHRYRLTDPANRGWVGLKNYGVVLTDSLWWNDVWTTVTITVITVVVELVIGFAFATVMHRIIFGRRTVRTSILVPYGIITVVSAFAWQYAFALDSGFVNKWLPFVDDNYSWFSGRSSSLFVIILSEVWKTTPFMSLLLLAGLAQVPEELQEAAKVDGATGWQRLWKVTLPNMKPAIMVALLFRTLDAYRIFDSIFIMTGGANNTQSVSFLTYQQVINRTDLGLGSAVSVLLFATVVLIAFTFIKLFRTDLSQVRGDQ